MPLVATGASRCPAAALIARNSAQSWPSFGVGSPFISATQTLW